MSLVLVKPDLDVWEAGEHTGTFRGNNLAFVTAVAALELWRNEELVNGIAERSAILFQELSAIAADYSQLQSQVRGIGLLFGLQVEQVLNGRWMGSSG